MKKQIGLLICLLISGSGTFGMEDDEAVEQPSKRLKISEECPEPASPVISVVSTVKFLTSDDQEFEVAVDVAKQSETIKHMLEDIGEDDEAIPLSNISGNTFKNVEKILKALLDEDQAGIKEILKSLSLNQLADLINAFNYLDVPDAMELAIQTFAQRPASNEFIELLYSFTESIKTNIWQQSSLFEFYYGQVLRWSIETPIISLKNQRTLRTEFSSDGRYYVIQKSHGIEIIDLSDYKATLVRVPFMDLETLLLPLDSSYVVAESKGLGDIYSYVISLSDKKTVIKLKNEIVHNVVGSLVFSYPSGEDEPKVYVRDLTNPETFNNPFITTEQNALGSFFVNPSKKLFGYNVEDENVAKIFVINDSDGSKLFPHPHIVDLALLEGENKLITVDPVQPNNNIKVWDVNFTDRPLVELTHKGAYQIIESDRGSYGVTISNDGTIKVWDFASGSEKLVTELYHENLDKIVVFQQGTILVSQSKEKHNGTFTVMVFDLQNLDERPMQFNYSGRPSLVLVDSKFLVANGKLEIGNSFLYATKIWNVNDLKHPVIDLHSYINVPFNESNMFINYGVVTSDGLFIGRTRKEIVFGIPTENSEQPKILFTIKIELYQVNKNGRYIALLPKVHPELKDMYNINIAEIIVRSDPSLHNLNEEQMKLLVSYYNTVMNNEPFTLSDKFKVIYDTLPPLLKYVIKLQ